MGEEIATIDPTRRESFTHWTPVTIRFSDQDIYGHVNNVAVAAYVEACRTMLIHPFLDRERHPELGFMLARVAIDYRHEFRYPGTVAVGGRVTRVGGKSFTSGYGLFLDRTCLATAESVNVFFDTVTRRPVTPPEDVRARLLASLEGAP